MHQEQVVQQMSHESEPQTPQPMPPQQIIEERYSSVIASIHILGGQLEQRFAMISQIAASNENEDESSDAEDSEDLSSVSEVTKHLEEMCSIYDKIDLFVKMMDSLYEQAKRQGLSTLFCSQDMTIDWAQQDYGKRIEDILNRMGVGLQDEDIEDEDEEDTAADEDTDEDIIAPYEMEE